MGFKVGDSASFSKTITETDIHLFAGISGDMNPVHIDAEYAKTTRFGQRICHGPCVVGLIGTVLGTRLPGPGTVYLGQNARFKAPVFIGDTVTATATIKSIRDDKPIYTLETTVTNQRGEQVIVGEAVVLYAPEK